MKDKHLRYETRAEVPARASGVEPRVGQSAGGVAAAERDAMASRLEQLLSLAASAGLRVDGLPLARALLSEPVLRRLETLVFNPGSLALLGARGRRLEFITEGLLPPAVLEDAAYKRELLYAQEVNYALCKGCRLCIQVCPKHVYTDDGFGKPDGEVRHSEACTGRVQCGQCVDLCPERAIRLVTVNPTLESTIYLLLPNLYLEGKAVGAAEFQVADPTAARGVVQLSGPLDPRDLVACHAALDAAHFWPLLELSGYARHFVDERDPEAALAAWAREQGREPRLVREGLALCYRALPELGPLKRGKYRLDEILHRLVDEVLHAGLDTEGVGGRAFLTALVLEAYAEPKLPGAKERPIGGLLPPGTSVAWKTPYGEEVPVYAHLERCLGPECALCVTHCPEGGGGPRSAIRMVYEVPQGTIPALVRGLGAHLLRLDGTHATTAEVEDLRGQRPFTFEVSADYCKSCGLCIVCCPHDVILGAPRQFDLKQVES